MSDHVKSCLSYWNMRDDSGTQSPTMGKPLSAYELATTQVKNVSLPAPSLTDPNPEPPEGVCRYNV